MKAKPVDLLDTLKTGEDKRAKCAELKEALARWGFKVKFNRRKLARGVKIYMVVEVEDGGNIFEGQRQTAMRSVINQTFPKAYMTSGGGSSATFAEGP